MTEKNQGKSHILASISSSMKEPYEQPMPNRGTHISNAVNDALRSSISQDIFGVSYNASKFDPAKSEKAHIAGRHSDKYSKLKKVAERQSITSSIDADITSNMAIGGIDVNRDTYDQFDLYAQYLISLLNTDSYSVANLAKHERFILFRYFYRTNPYVGRILDVSVEIALSKIRLEAPQNCPAIVRDFTMNFFQKIFDNLDLMEKFKELVLEYYIYGEAYGVVDDYYKDEDTILQDIKSIEASTFKLSKADEVFIHNIEERYALDPQQVSIEERQRYLSKKFFNYNPRYRGPDDFRVIKFFYISEYFKNNDIGYDAIRYELSQGLRNLLNQSDITEDDILQVGYSKGMLSLIQQFSNTSVIFDNNYLSGDPYLINFEKFEGSSLLYRVIDSCLEYDAAKRALKAKLRLLGKAGRVITSEGLSEPQLEDLQAEVEYMMENPTHAIVANYNINWQEVNDFVKQELSDLMTSADRIKQELSDGLGVPQSLISGESQYSNSVVTIDIINTQFFSLKLKFQNIINKKFIKPIALRKGLITLDEWGTPSLVFPKVAFSLTNLRSQEVFDVLFQLYQKGSLPVDILYDILNLNGDAVEAALKKDLWTPKNDKFNELVSSVYSSVSEEVLEKTDVAQRVIQSMGLSMKSDEVSEEGFDAEENSLPESGGSIEDEMSDDRFDMSGNAINTPDEFAPESPAPSSDEIKIEEFEPVNPAEFE